MVVVGKNRPCMQIPFRLRDAGEKQATERIKPVRRVEKMGFLISAAGNHVGSLFRQPMRWTMRPIIHGFQVPEAMRRVKPRREKRRQAAALHMTAWVREEPFRQEPD